MVAQLKRTLEIACSAGGWGWETQSLGNEFIDDLAAHRMSTARLKAVFKSLSLDAELTFFDIARALGSAGVLEWIAGREARRGDS